MKLILWLAFAAFVITALAWMFVSSSSGDSHSYQDVPVQRGTVVKQAVAVGNIEPLRKSAIKSVNGGVLTELFVALGDTVKKGQPLAEVRPVLTDLDILNAERSLKAAQNGLDSAQEFQGGAHLASSMMRMIQGQKNLNRMQEGARLQHERASHALTLLREGKVKIGNKEIDFVVRAPIDGTIVELPLREGAPVVASSSYGSGSVLMTIADLAHPLFLGTVAEIDVGRLRKGMSASVSIGALPGEQLEGKVTEVGLMARRVNNAVTFDVRIAIKPPEGLTIRAGFSATADIELTRRESTLVLPERVINFRNDKAFVTIRKADGMTDEIEVQTGLSNGLDVEILKGLTEGGIVLERIYGPSSR